MTRTPDRARWLAVAVAAAADAARFIAERQATRHELDWHAKGATDFVSAVDVGAEERIRAHFARALPEAAVVGEELGPDGDTTTGLVAIVDPLDGTTNFLHGFPAYGVSVCVALDGVPQAAVVHDVARGGVHTATAGGGAFVDGTPLRVSDLATPARALIGTGYPFKTPALVARYLGQMAVLMPETAGLRRAGSAALDLADVARGRFEGFWEMGLNAWDVAAGILLIREAGGRVTDLDGRDAPLRHGDIVASNGVLHDWLLGRLAAAAPVA
jgi:myo-inositol-1(or 4)-monophosphatase